MARRAKVGDLVRCASEYHRKQCGLGEEAGIVMEERTANCRVLYCGQPVSYWLPYEALEPAAGDAADPLTRRLHWILRHARPLAAELERAEPEGYRLTLAVEEAYLGTLEEVRAHLGQDFLGAHLVPRGSGEIGLEITFR